MKIATIDRTSMIATPFVTLGSVIWSRKTWRGGGAAGHRGVAPALPRRHLGARANGNTTSHRRRSRSGTRESKHAKTFRGRAAGATAEAIVTQAGLRMKSPK